MCRMHVEFFAADTSVITAGDTVNEMYILASHHEDTQVPALTLSPSLICFFCFFVFLFFLILFKVLQSAYQ